MRILGIDPGLQRTGFACLALDAGGQIPEIIDAGHISLRSDMPVHERLVVLERELLGIIGAVEPEGACVESLFAHYRHPTTAIAMGHARGVVMLTLARAGMGITQLRPTAVKRAVTGYGHASKTQVQHAVQNIFALPEPPRPDDVADALAVAYCGLSAAHAPRVDDPPAPATRDL